MTRKKKAMGCEGTGCREKKTVKRTQERVLKGEHDQNLTFERKKKGTGWDS